MAKYKNCPKSYKVFNDFKEKCLINDKSLIWPDKNAWTLENLNKIKEKFIDNPLEGNKDFFDKLFEQFSGLNYNCWRILADAFLIYTLPSTYIKPKKKYNFIKKICDKKGLELEDFSDEKWEVLNQGFTRTSLQYHQKYKQLWLLFLFSKKVKERENRSKFLNNHKEVKNELYNSLDYFDSGNKSYGMLNAILHLGYPEYYERIISLSAKERITDFYKDRIEENIRDDKNLDKKLLSIRKNFEKNEYKDNEFDFYNPEIQEKWRGKNSAGKDEETDEDEVVEEDPLLDELVSSLRRHKQIILYGPPGTGKTYYAKKLGRNIIAQDNFEKDYSQLNEEEKNQVEIGNILSAENKNEGKTNYLRFCTFHPAYGYEEFIEGYRPEVSDEGSPVFYMKEGIFKKICRDAEKNPEKSFVLIIDEINRGDIPRIFGELITLLEPEKRWEVGNKPEISVSLPGSEDNFAVPENVLIIGTMNTADQSIALLDVALRMRFGFKELMPNPGLLENQEIEGVNLGKWLDELNNRISDKIGRNLQVGHSYLMKNGEPIKNTDQLIAVFKDEILPLLQEYCYDDYSTLREIIGKELINEQKKRFKKDLNSSKGREIIIKAMKKLIPGDENSE